MGNFCLNVFHRKIVDAECGAMGLCRDLSCTSKGRCGSLGADDRKFLRGEKVAAYNCVLRCCDFRGRLRKGVSERDVAGKRQIVDHVPQVVPDGARDSREPLVA